MLKFLAAAVLFILLLLIVDLFCNWLKKAWNTSWHQSSIDKGYQWASRQLSLYNEPSDIYNFLCEWDQSTDFGKGQVEALQEHLTGVPRKVDPWYKRFLRALLL